MTLTTAAVAAPAGATMVSSVRPDWYTSLVTKRNKGESVSFLVWGSTDDYQVRGYPAERYLAETFASAGMDVVVRYSLDQGITFAAPGMERLYRKTLGLDQSAQDPTANRAGQILSQVAGKPVQVQQDPQAAAFAAIRKATGQKEPDALPNEPDEAIAQILDFLKLATFTSEEVPVDPQDPSKGTEQVRTPRVEGGARHAAAIIERLDLILPASDKATMPASRLRLIGRLHRASNDRALLNTGNPFIMLTPAREDVVEDVRVASSGTRAVEIPLPTFLKRLDFIRELQTTCLYCGKPQARHAGEDGLMPPTPEGEEPACDSFAAELVLDQDLSVEELAVATASLMLRHIEDIAMLARGGVLTRKMALARQRELLDAEYSEGLRPMDPSFGYEVLGGIDHLADMFRKWVITPLRSADARAKRYCPKGALLAGPPGTGKSVFARATAFEAGVAAVELSLTKSKWMGESARNMAKQIRGIRAYGRVVVFIDEYDKFLAQTEGAGDNSTDAELRKMWQEFTADPTIRGEVFFLAASNYPENILPALIRKGRIDWIAPMLAPGSEAERADIVVRQLRANGFDGYTVESPEVQKVARNSTDWTGSDLEAVVVKAAGSVAILGMSLGDALADAIATLVPSDPLAVQRMTRTALRYCSDLALLPPSRRTEAADLKYEPEPAPEVSQPARRTGGRGLEL